MYDMRPVPAVTPSLALAQRRRRRGLLAPSPLEEDGGVEGVGIVHKGFVWSKGYCQPEFLPRRSGLP
jgi:hypothetical protein